MFIAGMCNRCPFCRATLASPDPNPLDQMRCPRCSAELWVLAFSEGPAFFPRRPGESVFDLLEVLAGTQLGFSASEIEEVLRTLIRSMW